MEIFGFQERKLPPDLCVPSEQVTNHLSLDLRGPVIREAGRKLERRKGVLIFIYGALIMCQVLLAHLNLGTIPIQGAITYLQFLDKGTESQG